ncbi:hypothetical protein CTAM01_07132 [Colletotrichum tamarilloi]|uniref:Uncharacterized protein n=1 Tax=Colletotrichum tamarilloi TaxID=1209934 RepID=A0ABQ9RA51_9PEZI|nr:uncharacterized protein CTAM01_07132 [Colletotrichum tamarilloi]KAK1499211.1 hypothetical protein CTAM01_07132 [Colletotrichum tamarilloi]
MRTRANETRINAFPDTEPSPVSPFSLPNSPPPASMDHGESLLFPQVFPKVPTSSSRPVRQPYPGLCVFSSSLLLERRSNPPIQEGTFGPLS